MAQETVPTRDEIPDQYKFNAPSMFASEAAWEREVEELGDAIRVLAAFEGRLGEGPEVLAKALDVMAVLTERLGKVYVYASLSYAVNMRDQAAAMRVGRARDLFGRFAAAQAFFDPELLFIGQEKLARWMDQEPRLEILRHYVDDLFRKQAHVRSTEVESLLGMLSDPFSGVSSIAGALTDADFVFEPAVASDGTEIEVTQGSLRKILGDPDREARRTAWEHYRDQYLAYRNTLATSLTTSLKQNVFRMRARRYDSTLEMALFRHAIPTEVYHNLIDTFRRHLPTWHRYWAVRRKALGVDTLHPYDIWAPLTDRRVEIPYQQAVNWICEGLAPLGEDYVATLRRGVMDQRWVDVYPNQGKRSGAFSSGRKGTYPFICMSYNEDIFSLSTLAHELGHSMHSYLTWEHQPFLYEDYSLFVAEVASNLHQALVRRRR
ncbi:MAG: M3 family oligoendopeptidase, partial [Anaerolineae bacterium]